MNVRKIRETFSEAPNAYKNYYVPLFKVDCNNKAYHAGTAFGLELGGKKYLVTAAHVLQKDYTNACDADNEIFVFVNGIFTQIKRFDTLNIAHNKMPLDVLAIQPKDFNLDDVFEGFFTRADINSRKLSPGRPYVAACGFPSSKNRLLWNTNRLTQRPYGYFGEISKPQKLRKIGKSTTLYTCFDILIKKTYSAKQKEIKAPKPHGISGGPVFYVYNFSKPRAIFRPKLVGMVIENEVKHQCMVFINIAVLLNFMAR